MGRNGHPLASHTYDHLDFTKNTVEDFQREILRNLRPFTNEDLGRLDHQAPKAACVFLRPHLQAIAANDPAASALNSTPIRASVSGSSTTNSSPP